MQVVIQLSTINGERIVEWELIDGTSIDALEGALGIDQAHEVLAEQLPAPRGARRSPDLSC